MQWVDPVSGAGMVWSNRKGIIMIESSNPRILHVKGEGTVRVDPDLLVLGIKIERLEPEYVRAITEVNAKTDLARQSIERCGIARSSIKTSGFRIDPEYGESIRGTRPFLGFKAKHQLRVEIPMDREKINAVFRALAGCGADPEIGIRFEVSDSEGLKQRAIEAAVKNAADRAEIIARAAGLKIGPIVKIDYGFSEVQVYHTDFLMNACGADGNLAAPDLEPQALGVSDRVNVTWQLI